MMHEFLPLELSYIGATRHRERLCYALKQSLIFKDKSLFHVVVSLQMSIELPNSALIVLSSLTAEGPMSPKTIIKKVQMPSRTITYALQTLVKENIVKKIPNLLDMRQPIYHVNLERVKELRLSYRVDQVIRLHPDIRSSSTQSHTFNR